MTNRTVIIVNPMGTDVTPFVNGTALVPQLLKGTIAQAGDTFYTLPYTNQPGAENVIDGGEELNVKLTELAAGTDDILIFAYSEGCEVVSYWLNTYGPTSGISPSRMKVLLIGNPVRKHGGFAYENDKFAAVAYYHGVPEDTQFQVTDFARQFDSVADYPTAQPLLDVLNAVQSPTTDPNYITNVLNQCLALLGSSYRDALVNLIAGLALVHNIYLFVAPSDANCVRKTEGNITYVWSPTKILPMLDWLGWAPAFQAQQDIRQRPAVEAAYARPVNLTSNPVPDVVTPKPSTGVPLPQIGSGGRPKGGTDPLSSYIYLDARRRVMDAEAKQRPLIRLWDNRMRYIGTIASEKSVNAQQILHDTGSGDIVINGNDWLVEFLRTDVRTEEDLHITIDPYPNNRNWRWRWGAKITNVRVKRDPDGLHTITLECAENREHWKHLLFGATPFMPPEVQPLKAWLMPANARTGIFITAFINLARIFFPPLALVDNALNPGSWIGGANLGNFNPLNWPIQMQFVNPLFDQSRLSVLMSRWSPAHDATLDILKDSGCNVRAYTWLEEDEDSPHPELAAIIGEQAARPTRNCIVLATVDDSGVTGITGTAIDGVINFIAATGDDLITTTLYEVIGDSNVIDPITNSPAPPLIRKLLGAGPKLPDVVFRDGVNSPIVSSEHAMYRSKAKHLMTGGKSPGWVNQLQTFGIKFALSQLQTVVTAGVFGQAGAAPIGSGLEEIYQGQLDDMLLSYIRFTDPVRDLRVGEYGYLEHFEQGTGSAYTVSSVQTLRQAHFRTRPYQAFKVQVLSNGHPHRLYYDYDLGTRVLFELDGLLNTDQVSATCLHYDEDTPKTFDLSIGQDGELEDGIGRVTRGLATVWSAISMAFGSGDLF